ncbi:transposase [Exiguobacterium sp. SH0S1]|nr:transposase [Exiguobacterium sp. SH0S1]
MPNCEQTRSVCRALIEKASARICESRRELRRVGIIHTDRGSEFNNRLVSDTLRSFGIRHSFSDKGCPCDNTVSEAMYKVIKTEFVRKRNFPNLTVLDRELRDYIH